ncbi:MAG: hypothetical protein EAZ27_09755 [Cytophagales bacterium]|nr:MAG: hypothetical protein EAZ27_09755 [Cytophagales bacterium]
MKLQLIQDRFGMNTGIFIPINDWNTIIKKHKDLGALVNIDNSIPQKLSELAGKLSNETALEMKKHVAYSRTEWEERL